MTKTILDNLITREGIWYFRNLVKMHMCTVRQLYQLVGSQQLMQK